ncbi:MAG TPA: alpha/beta hydrolase [Pyrinomonadaceae bacterium]|nr:alpha/beta hydrolase [Pyrinomonadaceae bacterium]
MAVQLYYETYGSGEPMVFLHGLGASIYTWRKVKDPLAAGNKLFLIDLKGFGKSPKPRDDRYSSLDQADLIYDFILENDLKNLTVVGNSYGGAISLLLAIRLCAENPNRLSKLVLIDSAGYNKLIPWYVTLLRIPILGWLMVHLASNKTLAKTVLEESYYNDQLITDADVEAYAEPLGMENGKYALLKAAKQAIPSDFEGWIAKYPTISVPTLILWGEYDTVIPVEIGEMLDAAIPCSKLTIIPNTGHIPQEETPTPTIELIKDFLKNSIPCP